MFHHMQMWLWKCGTSNWPTMPKVRGIHVRWHSVTTIEIPCLLLWYSKMITMAPLSSSESWITFYWVIFISPERYSTHFWHGDFSKVLFLLSHWLSLTHFLSNVLFFILSFFISNLCFLYVSVLTLLANPRCLLPLCSVILGPHVIFPVVCNATCSITNF